MEMIGKYLVVDEIIKTINEIFIIDEKDLQVIRDLFYSSDPYDKIELNTIRGDEGKMILYVTVYFIK